jgi:hypothetical protein
LGDISAAFTFHLKGHEVKRKMIVDALMLGGLGRTTSCSLAEGKE